MSSATASPSASEAVARFVAARYTGEAFEDALRSARTSLIAARTALRTPSATAQLAARALASYGSPLRRAFTDATSLAATAAGRGDAPILAAALAASALSAASGAAASGAAAGSADAVGADAVAEAVAAGREVAERLRRALALDEAWDAVAVTAGIGAAAAAARAIGLDADAARHAIGLAATQAAGLGVLDGTPAAALACGKAAADAVEAALLARNGFTAAPASLEGRRGLAALMASHFAEAALCDGLGVRWLSAEG